MLPQPLTLVLCFSVVVVATESANNDNSDHEAALQIHDLEVRGLEILRKPITLNHVHYRPSQLGKAGQ
jgi:hypothetical protein